MQKRNQSFLNVELLGSLGLFIAATIGIVLFNSPLQTFYENIINHPLTIKTHEWEFTKPFIFWINDGLICLFFLLLGLEMKREIIEGELSEKNKLSLPVATAICGAIIPALIYTGFNYHDPINMRGWAIPTAMDTAFCLGVLALVRGVPKSIKIFLVSMAIIDDILAVATIALFYAQDLSHISVLSAAIIMGVLILLNQMRVNAKLPYLILGFLLWITVLRSGVHTSIVGVLLAISIPHRRMHNQPSMLESIEKTLHPWVAFVVVPLFAFANSGVPLAELAPKENISDPLALGIILGLFVGKQIGVFGTAYILVKINKAQLPTGTNWLQMYGASVLCGIGFTMSLFIGSLAFENNSLNYINTVKASIFIASFFSALCGYGILSLNKYLVKRETRE